MNVENNGISLVQASIKYGVSAARLKVWLRTYRQGGIESLSITKKRGRQVHECTKRISEIFALHHKRYDYRRICAQLRNEGYIINHKTVQKLMQEMQLKSVVRRVKYRSYKGEVGRVAANVPERDFSTLAPNRKWATDVTEFKIGDRKAYLSPILDMYNGEIISYTISDSPDLRMVMNMVNNAIRKIKPQAGLVLHSDQGWHYQHLQYQLAFKRNGIIQSISRKGNRLDNAINCYICRSSRIWSIQARTEEAYPLLQQ